MSRTTVRQLRVSHEENDMFRWAAAQRGEDVSSWLRRLAKEDADLLKAEQSDLEEAKVNRQQTLEAAFPQGRPRCGHVPKGQWCYACNAKRW